MNKEVNFNLLPFNEVDLVCLNELVYLPFELLDRTKTVSLNILKSFYYSNKNNIKLSFTVTKERLELLEAIFDSIRYKDLVFWNPVSETSSEYKR